MKKNLIAIALMSCAVLAFASCGETATETPADNKTPDTEAVTEAVTEAHEPTESELHPLPAVDMNGFEMRFYNFDESWLTWAIMQIGSEAENGDNVNDAIFRRNTRIEEQYNCKIKETLVTDTASGFSNMIMSGEDLYDITMVYDENCAPYYCQGYIRSFDCLPYVDTERSWWAQNANPVFSLMGKQFAAVGDFYLGMASRGFVLLFNKNLYQQLDAESTPYEYVRSNNWTLDTFYDLTKDFARDLDGNGVMDVNDQYATTGAIKLHFGSLVTGCGVKYIQLDADGVPYFAIPGNDYAMTVFEKIFSMHEGTNIYYKIYSDVHGGSAESRVVFSEQRTLFQGTATKGISYYRDCDFDIGIVPYPKYDSAQENYYILTSGTGVATIPATLPDERCENVSIILDAMCRDSQSDLIPTYRETVLKTKYSRDEDSAEMLDIIFASGTFDLGLSIWPNETYYKYMECYLKMQNNFASLTEKSQSKVDKQINKLLEALEETR